MSMFQFNTKLDPAICTFDDSCINLAKPDINLFNDTAKQVALEMTNPELLEWNRRNQMWEVKRKKSANKITQLRKFYDEICMWEAKNRNIDTFKENLPFIKMLNAKVAYARSREYVDDKFMAMIDSCLSQISDTDEENLKKFKNFRTFFEAFYGFYRAERPKD